MCTWNGSHFCKGLAWLFVCLAIISALFLETSGGPAQAQEASPTPTSAEYPVPLPTYSTLNAPYPGPETATFVPTQATTSSAGAPIPTLQATATFPGPTSQLAPTQPGLQITQGLQPTSPANGLQPTYIPFPTIYFQLPDEITPDAAPLSQTQTSPTPIVSQGDGGVGRWVPLGVILVIWGLLAGWFYLSFRRLG
jgi:hypothetical protein